MDLLEHQGKQLFAEAGLPVLPSVVARTPDEARRAAGQLGPRVCVKAQTKTGGRGKAGGIRVCGTAAEVEAAAADILAMTIHGHPVEALLVERAVDIARELYLAITVSREVRGPMLIFAREGGVDIEELARRAPDAIVRRPIDPLLGLLEYQVRDVVDAAAFGPDDPGGTGAGKALAAACRSLWKLYRDRDCTLAEVNPLVLTTGGEVDLPGQQGDRGRERLLPAPRHGAAGRPRTNARTRPARRASRSSRWTATSASSATAPAS